LEGENPVICGAAPWRLTDALLVSTAMKFDVREFEASTTLDTTFAGDVVLVACPRCGKTAIYLDAVDTYAHVVDVGRIGLRNVIGCHILSPQ